MAADRCPYLLIVKKKKNLDQLQHQARVAASDTQNKLVCVRSLNFSILFQCEHPKLQIGLFVQGVYCGSMMSLNILWIMLEKGVSSTGEDRTIFLKLEGGGTQKKMGN